MKKVYKNQSGFALLLPIIAVVLVIGVGGTQVYRINESNKQNARQQESTQQLEAALELANDAKESNEADLAKQKEAEEQKPASAPTPAPKPVAKPAPAPAPKPELDLYNSPKDNFEICPGTVTAYVVNKAGAKLYANYGDAYNNKPPVSTAPYKAALTEAGCQDGEPLSVKYNGNQYVVYSADVRKTKP